MLDQSNMAILIPQQWIKASTFKPCLPLLNLISLMNSWFICRFIRNKPTRSFTATERLNAPMNSFRRRFREVPPPSATVSQRDGTSDPLDGAVGSHQAILSEGRRPRPNTSRCRAFISYPLSATRGQLIELGGRRGLIRFSVDVLVRGHRPGPKTSAGRDDSLQDLPLRSRVVSSR